MTNTNPNQFGINMRSLSVMLNLCSLYTKHAEPAQHSEEIGCSNFRCKNEE